jgi:hypothetical protein
VSRTRNASTILHADFVGNSRLAATDDDRALPRRVGQGVDLLDPAMGPHDGRIGTPTADGGLIEFYVFGAEHHAAENGSIRFLASFQ